jgi:TPP-dependent pyruvate/acetoin dehydrogenase alpha subunit
MMNKSTVDPTGNYADYLAGTVESNKASFTEAELKTLTEDIDAIRKIEEQIRKCKCQYKIVVYLSYKNVEKPTFLYDIFI